MTAVCAWCQREGRLTILDGTAVDQAILDLEADDLTHGICENHSDAMMDAYYRDKERADAKQVRS